MKKIIIALVLVLGAMSLASCGGYGGSQKDKTERPAEANFKL